MLKREICTAEKWESSMSQAFSCHVLQSTQWADFKGKTGWRAQFLLWWDNEDNLLGGASVLIKTNVLPLLQIPLAIMYVPRGPILDWQNEELVSIVLADLGEYARENQAVYIKIDPEVFFNIEENQEIVTPCAGKTVEAQLKENRWRYAREQIQFKNTFWLSLIDDEEKLLANMKQKTRYNIRLAMKKGVEIRAATEEDFHLIYQMYAETSQRDGFIIRDEDYYYSLWKKLYQAKMAYGLIALYDDVPLAGLMNFVYQKRAWYFYGMSTTKQRNLMPTYLLQWEAIKYAKSLGCEIYDMWGAPDEIDEKDSMYGVFRFKQGLGASLVRGIGAWDYVVKPFWYQIISIVLPSVLGLMRFMRRNQINQEIT
ncbi:MAG: peptidoglycan bridge formation glycyltransferase FemA/FemB family protein [Anaerolineaceae bacterium]|nr:peptidoglycan bridge formation glycyltransferase FemA/FemB family protein [Anaerolineaceae bacterium]